MNSPCWSPIASCPPHRSFMRLPPPLGPSLVLPRLSAADSDTAHLTMGNSPTGSPSTSPAEGLALRQRGGGGGTNVNVFYHFLHFPLSPFFDFFFHCSFFSVLFHLPHFFAFSLFLFLPDHFADFFCFLSFFVSSSLHSGVSQLIWGKNANLIFSLLSICTKEIFEKFKKVPTLAFEKKYLRNRQHNLFFSKHTLIFRAQKKSCRQ